MGIFYAYTTHLYLSGSRELKRAESVGLSPMYGVFGETLNGVSTIRTVQLQLIALTGDNYPSIWRWLSLHAEDVPFTK